MTKIILTGGLLATILAFTSGCAAYGVINHSKAGTGSIFTSVKQGLVDTGETGEKVGRACTMNILGVAAWGDGSIAAAKKNGGITTVATVDEELLNVLGIIYGEYCTVVTGS